MLDFYSQHGHQTKFFRSDSETVLTDGATKDLITSRSIQPGKSVPYAHYQNRAERYVQTTLNGVTTANASFLHVDGLGHKLISFLYTIEHQTH